LINTKNCIFAIILVGIPLDISTTYNLLNNFANPENLMSLLSNKIGSPIPTGLGIENFLNKATLLVQILFSVFIIVDIYAFFNLFKYKNWARVYVLSISILYALSSLISFSLIPFVYGCATTYILFSKRKLFTYRKTPLESDSFSFKQPS